MRNLGDDDNGMLGRVAFLLVVVVSFSAFVSARQKNGLSILTPQKNEKLHPLFVLSSGSGRRVATADTLGVRAAHRPAVHAKRRDRSGVNSITKCSALGTAQSRSIPFPKFATREGSRTNDPAWPRSSPRGFSVLRSHVGFRHDARSDHAGLAFRHHDVIVTRHRVPLLVSVPRPDPPPSSIRVFSTSAVAFSAPRNRNLRPPLSSAARTMARSSGAISRMTSRRSTWGRLKRLTSPAHATWATSSPAP
jgi:hypothetical protein